MRRFPPPDSASVARPLVPSQPWLGRSEPRSRVAHAQARPLARPAICGAAGPAPGRVRRAPPATPPHTLPFLPRLSPCFRRLVSARLRWPHIAASGLFPVDGKTSELNKHKAAAREQTSAQPLAVFRRARAEFVPFGWKENL